MRTSPNLITHTEYAAAPDLTMAEVYAQQNLIQVLCEPPLQGQKKILQSMPCGYSKLVSRVA